MTTFDEKYYNDIWGTVHRHDYCETIANDIISKYGKCRVLDIGTGCGYLVKTLREKGCEAFGLEISQYAIQNSCCPGYILHGSVTNIPFRDNYFDVVHSNGLWCYLNEDEVKKAADEVHRVGKHQIHNIDTTDGYMPPEIKAVTFKPHTWWNEQIKPPKILVACPTHECKEYAMERWINTVLNFTYPNVEILLVDNSPTTYFYQRWKDKIPMIHIEECEKEPDMCRRIAMGMEIIRKKFISGNYYKWFNLEIDVIPEDKSLIELLLHLGKDIDWVAHTYPGRGCEGDDPKQSGVGCALFSRKLMESLDFNRAGYDKCPDAWLWDYVRPLNKFVTAELWSLSKIKHLAS